MLTVHTNVSGDLTEIVFRAETAGCGAGELAVVGIVTHLTGLRWHAYVPRLGFGPSPNASFGTRKQAEAYVRTNALI